MSSHPYVRLSVAAIAAVVLAAMAEPAGAQNRDARGRLVGTVVDSATAEPIVAAIVRLVPTRLTETTHGDGRFVLGDIEPGTYTLVVEQLGYRRSATRLTIEAGTTADVRVALTVSAIELSGIIVTGALSPRSRDDVLSPASSLSGAELDRRSDQTVAGMIAVEPGVAVSSLGPTTARPVIRGLGGDRILILEDGQRPGDLSSTSGDHAVAIEPLSARQIEVVRGPMSLLYGSSALGGVINVVREAIPTTLPHGAHGTLSVQGASVNDGVSGGGILTAGFGPVAVRAEAVGRTNGDQKTPDGVVSGTDARTGDFSLGIGVPRTHGYLGGAYRYYTNDYGVPGGFVGGHAQGVDIAMHRHTFRVSGEIHRDESFFSRLEVDGGYTNYAHTETEPSGAIGTSFGQDLAQGEIVARHGSTGALSEGALGARFQYRDISTGGTLRTPSTYDVSAAGFAVEEIGRGSLRLQVGLRYDWARYTPRDTTSFVSAGGERIPVRSRAFGSVSGSVGVLWLASDLVRFGASVARAYRTPDFNELYSDGPHLAANSYDVGDPSLDQETGLGIDLFARVTHDRVHAEVAAFRNSLSDYIFPSSRGRAELGTQGGRPRFQYTNEDARFIGVEGEIEVSLTDVLRFDAGGSLVNAEFTSDRSPIPVFDGLDTTFVAASEYPPLIPPARGRVGLRIERPAGFIGANTQFVAAQDRLGDFETRTDGYTLFDATAGLRVTRGSMLHTITLRIDNLFDTGYRDHLSRIKDLMPGPGRGVSLLYRMVF
jgi:iron complex outermembrane receptor protein